MFFRRFFLLFFLVLGGLHTRLSNLFFGYRVHTRLVFLVYVYIYI